MSLPQWDVLCAGIVVADHVCEPVDRIPRPGELVLTGRLDLTVGGCAANVSVDLAKLGRAVGLVGVVGRDVFGQFVRQTMEAAGVDCSHLLESDDRETSGTLIVNERGQDRRFIHSIGANADFTGRELSPELVGACRVLYLGGFLLSPELTADNVAAAFATARRAGVRTVLDVVVPGEGDYTAALATVLPHTDVFLPNADEAMALTGLSDPFDQAERFRALGAKTVAVTCGADGAVLVSDDQRLRAERYDVPVLDGTGSGDAFSAGFIHSMLNGSCAAECLRRGSALGASSVQAIGATTGVFNADQLEAFCRDYALPVESL